MINENILGLNGEIITLEQLKGIEENKTVESIEDNGISYSNKYYGKHWYTVTFNETFISANCDDVNSIHVYTNK